MLQTTTFALVLRRAMAALAPKKVAVFNYGSNGVAQLRARVRNPALTLRQARAPAFSRVFCLEAPNWQRAGVASLAPGDGARGSLALLSEEEKLLLDAFEKPKYREVEIDVDVRDGDVWTPARAVAYVAGDGVAEWTEAMTAEPCEAYRAAIVAHLRTAGWPTGEPLEIRCARRGLRATWRYPVEDPRTLSLESLAVEVNTRRRAPWTMPAAIGPFVEATRAAGFATVGALAAALADGAADARLAAGDAQIWDADAVAALRRVPLHRVFTYGSLRRGLFNDGYLGRAVFVGDAATAAEYALVTNGRLREAPYTWPYAIAADRARLGSALSRLAGELYVCSTEDLAAVDELEEHPHHYRRDRVDLAGGGDAWMYVLVDEAELAAAERDPENYADVGGDWVAFTRTQGNF